MCRKFGAAGSTAFDGVDQHGLIGREELGPGRTVLAVDHAVRADDTCMRK